MALSPTRVLSLVPTIGLAIIPALSAAGAASNAQDELDKRAPIASPSFTGIVSLADRLLVNKTISGAAPAFAANGDMVANNAFIVNDRQLGAGVQLENLTAVASISSQYVGYSSPQRGSAVSRTTSVYVFDTDRGANPGSMEFAPEIRVLRARPDRTNGGANWWGMDSTLAGPVSAREQYMGDVHLFRKQAPGNGPGLIGGVRYYGSVGKIILATTLTQGGGSFGAVDEVTTYTMDAGLQVAGWAGPYGTANGQHANATPAFGVGIAVGGYPIAPWVGHDGSIRSKITTGIRVQDFVGTGMVIENGYDGSTPLIIQSQILGSTVGAFVNAQAASARSTTSGGNLVALTQGFRRHAAGTDWKSVEHRTFVAVDNDLSVGAWMAYRATSGGAMETLFGRGVSNTGDVRIRETGALNLNPMGAAPAAKVNGDIWHYNDQIMARLNGVDVALGAPGSFPAYSPAGAAVLNTPATAAQDYQLYFYDAGTVVATRINTISPAEAGCVANSDVNNGANIVALVNRAIVTGKNVLIDGVYMTDPITHVLPTGAQVRFIGRVGACIKGRSGAGGAVYRFDGDFTQEVTWDGIMVDASLRTFVSGAASGTGLNFRKLKRFHATRSFFYGGLDYTESVGGDSGISATMCLDGSVTLCDFQGWKDKGNYFSGSELTDPSIIRGRYYLDGNVYYRCNTGWSATRQVELVHSTGESFIECLYGFAHTETGTDLLPGGRGIIVTGAFAKKVGRIARLHGYGARDRIEVVGEDYGFNPLTGAAMPSRQAAIRLDGSRGADIEVSLCMKDWADSTNHAGIDLRNYTLNIGFTGGISGDVLTAGTPDQGFFAVGQAIVGAAAGTYITEDLGGAGGAGNYRVSVTQTLAAGTALTARQTVTGSISGDVFTVAGSPSHGVLQAGVTLSGGTVAAGTVLVKPGATAGTWIVSPSQTVGSTLMTVDQTWKPQGNRITGRMSQMPLGIGIYENNGTVGTHSDVVYDNVGTPVFSNGTTNSPHVIRLLDGTVYDQVNNIRFDGAWTPSITITGSTGAVITPTLQIGSFNRTKKETTQHYNARATINIPTAAVVTGSAGAEVSGSISSNTLNVATLFSGQISVGDIISGPGIKSGTTITALGTGTGGTGTYTVSATRDVGTVNITVASTKLVVSGVTSGALAVAHNIRGTGMDTHTVISALGTGTGGVGTYTMDIAQTFASAAISAYLVGQIRVTGQPFACAAAKGDGGGGLHICTGFIPPGGFFINNVPTAQAYVRHWHALPTNRAFDTRDLDNIAGGTLRLEGTVSLPND